MSHKTLSILGFPKQGFQDMSKDEDIKTLEFQKNLNRKFNCDIFSIILPVSKDKKLGQKFCIRLRGQVFCFAFLVKKETLTLAEIIEKECYLLESGLEKQEFVTHIENFYSKKKFWKQTETKFYYLVFKKERQLKLFENEE